MILAWAILASAVVAYLLIVRRRPTAPAKPPAPPPAPEGERAEADRGMSDPVLRRLYMLLFEITQVSPEVTRPEHLNALPGYREAVELLADPAVKGEVLFDLV